MIFNLILAGVLILSFFLCVCSYALGIRHGRAVVSGGAPRVNPVKAVKKAVQNAADARTVLELEEGMSEIIGMSRESMLKSLTHERNERTGAVR